MVSQCWLNGAAMRSVCASGRLSPAGCVSESREGRALPTGGMVNVRHPPTACLLGFLSHCHSQKCPPPGPGHTLVQTCSGQGVGWASLPLVKNCHLWEDSHKQMAVVCVISAAEGRQCDGTGVLGGRGWGLFPPLPPVSVEPLSCARRCSGL